MAILRDYKSFQSGGLNADDAIEYRPKNDFFPAYNIRLTGTQSLEEGYVTNIESNQLLSASVAPGINRCIGSDGFPQIRAGIGFIYNSAGYNQIVKVDFDTNVVTTLFTDLSNTGGEAILPLNPSHYVDDIKLINNEFLLWNDAFGSIGYTNLNTLESGGYGTVLAEDFSLIKPQALDPITAEYISDSGRASNFLKQNLYQFLCQWEGFEYSKSAFSTRSKRIIPPEESTPTVGTDVTANNGIVVHVPVGSIRVKTIYIGARSTETTFDIVKQVERTYVLSLPNTAVSVADGVYEAYNPTTGLYSFVFYGEDLSIPIAGIETDLAYDAVPRSADALEVINGNIVGLGGIRVGYERPTTAVTVQAVGYDPNITVPLNEDFQPFIIVSREAVKLAADILYIIHIVFDGTPATNDVISITTVNTRNATGTHTYTYTVPASQDGDIAAVIASYAATLPSGSYSVNMDGMYTITFYPEPFYTLQTASISLYNAGVTVSRSIHSFLPNSSYQAALRYIAPYGRYFPLRTDNSFIFNTPSSAQINGQAVQLSWAINTAEAPEGAIAYQWMITPNNTVNTTLDVLATPLVYKGSWDAHGNTPTLVAGTAPVGDTYQITTPSLPGDNRNLGNGVQEFKTGDYVVGNGLSWDIVNKQFGDLTTGGNILALKINPLDAFNTKYTNAGADTVLTYDFAQGDRCTLNYYIDGGENNYINNPCVDLDVLGYDPTTFLVKVEKSATFDEASIDGKNVFITLYSPKPQNNTLLATEWFEIGEKFDVIDGLHAVTSGLITDGDVYYKTRQYSGSVDPNTPYEVLAVDFNFSDFYASAYWSKGRVGTYNDEIEATLRPAIIIRSEPYIFGSRNNGLTRFYPISVYGDSGGETSSNFGTIRSMKQVNNELLILQESNHGTIPIYANAIETQNGTEILVAANKLFGNIRYTASKHIGIGNAKESVAIYNNIVYWIDPNRSEPIRWSGNGALPISGKMSKYFKSTLQVAYAAGLKIIGWYDIYNDEYVISIQQPGGVVQSFAFSPDNWQFLASYSVLPGDITISRSPSHSSPSYNPVTGIVVLSPSTDYVGNDSLGISFPGGSKNVCFTWTAGNNVPNPFAFAPIDGQPLSTSVYSNFAGINGIDYPSPISIDSGEYCVNDSGIWVSAPGFVNNGDTVQVRQTSSASYSTLTTIHLTVGGFTAPFNVTTKSSTPPPGTYFSVLGDEGLTVIQVKNNIPAIGIPSSLNSISVPPGGRLDVTCGTLTTGNFSVRLTGTPNAGTYLKFRVNGVLTDEQAIPTSGIWTLDYGTIDPAAYEYKVSLENGSG